MADAEGLSASDWAKRCAIIEGDRKAYASETQKLLRQQEMMIQRLEKEHKEMQAKVALETRFASSSSSAKIVNKIERLQKQHQEMVRLVNEEKQKQKELSRRTRELRRELVARKKGVMAVTKGQNQVSKTEAQIGTLENRLEQGLVRYNEVLAGNKRLRDDIENLRLERSAFDENYRALAGRRDTKRKTIDRLVRESRALYDEREELRHELAELKGVVDTETRAYEAEHRELTKIMEREQMRRNVLMGPEDEPEPALGIDSAPSERMITIERDDHAEAASNAATVDAIKRVTGVESIEEVVPLFVEAEDRNFSLFNFTNELQNEAESLEEELAKLRLQLSGIEASAEERDSAMRATIIEMEQTLEACQAEEQQHTEKIAQMMADFGDIKAAMADILAHIGCNDCGADHGITEATVLATLGNIEHKTIGLLDELNAVKTTLPADAVAAILHEEVAASPRSEAAPSRLSEVYSVPGTPAPPRTPVQATPRSIQVKPPSTAELAMGNDLLMSTRPLSRAQLKKTLTSSM